jgi:YidC/Oxa1 family membrane protein insertase
VLPLLMGATMYFQQTLNPPMPDPMQARMMKLMPPIFTVMFAFFPSGLVLYWFVNNLLSIAQQWWVTKQVEAEAKVKA